MEQRVTIVTEVREGRMAGGLQHHLGGYSTTWWSGRGSSGSSLKNLEGDVRPLNEAVLSL